MNTNELDTSSMVSVKEAAIMLGIKHRAVRMLHSRGRLQGERVVIGARLELRFSREAVAGFQRLKRGWTKGKPRKKPIPIDPV